MRHSDIPSGAMAGMTGDESAPRQAGAADARVRGRGRAVAVREWLREGPVTEEGEEKRKGARRAELPLKKHTGRMEIVRARFVARELTDLLERHPDHFTALRAIVDGRPEEATEAHRRDLREWLYLLPDGSPRPNVRLIMAAAVRDTPDGPVIVDPLDAARPEDAVVMKRADEELERIKRKGWAELKRRVFGDGRDDGRSPER